MERMKHFVPLKYLKPFSQRIFYCCSVKGRCSWRGSLSFA